MITPIKKNINLLLLAASFGALIAGCAGTPTKDSTGEYVDDSTVTAKVKEALVADDAVKAFDIHVVTFKGSVQLSGWVDSGDQKSDAKRDAESVRGVKDVENNISVK